tara:strand:+ start:2085 stop:2216 length:132 start_codon:yes stop_codon:yes gene_type:complete
MKEKEFELDGIKYTVRATTEDGVKRAIRSLKKSIKKNKEQDGI